MGKKLNKEKQFKNLVKQEMAEIKAEERRIAKRRRAAMAACSHTRGKHYTIDFSRNNQAYCRECGAKFSLKTFDLAEVSESAKMLNSALQQVRLLADEREDADLISDLGRLAADIEQVEEIYRRHLDRYGKNGNGKKKNRNNHENDSSQYGGYNSVVSVMEGAFGGKKRK